ncbi:SRPBCC family protein [Glycomyces xiaoerkulensis]|uniref:SRPBCC family protein n=1 Tax=Glycomyces xiaoerkulensis TaxID=2038139 RepID=UPI000C263830|nr:SRPBCC family protein [Glycomyces xiaoerkulensis]
MTLIRNSVVLPCDPEEAFDYLSDLRSELEWNPDCTSMEKVTGGPVDQGTKFRARWKGSPETEVTITDYRRPTTWTAHAEGSLEINFTARLEPSSGSTELNVDFDVRPHGFFRLVFPAIQLMLRRQEKANMRRLRETFERRAGANPDGG